MKQTSISTVRRALNKIGNWIFGFTASKKKVDPVLIQTKISQPQLTGLPDRNYFISRVSKETIIEKNERKKFAVLLLDINNFDKINSSFTRQAGDQILQQIAHRLQKNVTRASCLAHLGSDDFGVILTDFQSEENVMQVAEAIYLLLKQPFVIDNNKINIDIAVGISYFPEHGKDSEQLINHAEIAMNYAKSINTPIALFNKHMIDKTHIKKPSLKDDLKLAISTDQLKLFYQPIIKLRNTKLVGVESLAHWIHPAFGLIRPNEFIPLAERIGLIHDLTQLVLKNSMKQCRQWHENKMNFIISINLSPLDIVNTDLVDIITNLLHETKIKPEWLNLEITKTALLQDLKPCLKNLKQLSKLGVNFSLDDFNADTRLLNQIAKLPIKEIKLERSLITNLELDLYQQKIVQHIIEVAHQAGIQVLAKGITTQNAYELLVKMKCDYGQGFYISRPLGSEDFTLWLENPNNQFQY